MDRFHVSATGLSINYLPEYVARHLGFFADEGIEVTSSVPEPWVRVLDDLHSGTAQAALGGVWVPAMYRGRGKQYAVFAQISARCPLVLLTRIARPDFDFRDLEGQIVLAPGAGGSSVFLYLAGLAQKRGCDLTKVRFLHDLPGRMFTELFIGGMGDFLIVDPLTAARLLRDGSAYLAASLAAKGDIVPWSVYYGLPALMNRDDRLVLRFVRALARGHEWVRSHSAETARPAIAAFWPVADVDLVVSVVSDFLAAGLWSETPRVDPDGLAEWQDMITAFGMLEQPFAYDELIDSRALVS